MLDGEPAARSLDAAVRRSALDAVGMMIVDAYIEPVVAPLTSARVMAGRRTGTRQGQWGSLTKLQSTVGARASVRTALAAWGGEGVIGTARTCATTASAWRGSSRGAAPSPGHQRDAAQHHQGAPARVGAGARVGP